MDNWEGLKAEVCVWVNWFSKGFKKTSWRFFVVVFWFSLHVQGSSNQSHSDVAAPCWTSARDLWGTSFGIGRSLRYSQRWYEAALQWTCLSFCGTVWCNPEGQRQEENLLILDVKHTQSTVCSQTNCSLSFSTSDYLRVQAQISWCWRTDFQSSFSYMQVRFGGQIKGLRITDRISLGGLGHWWRTSNVCFCSACCCPLQLGLLLLVAATWSLWAYVGSHYAHAHRPPIKMGHSIIISVVTRMKFMTFRSILANI